MSNCRPVCDMQAQQMSRTRLWYSAQSWSHTWSLQASGFDKLAPSRHSVRILPTQLYLSNQKETPNVYTSRPALYQIWESSRSLMNWFKDCSCTVLFVSLDWLSVDCRCAWFEYPLCHMVHANAKLYWVAGAVHHWYLATVQGGTSLNRREVNSCRFLINFHQGLASAYTKISRLWVHDSELLIQNFSARDRVKV